MSKELEETQNLLREMSELYYNESKKCADLKAENEKAKTKCWDLEKDRDTWKKTCLRLCKELIILDDGIYWGGTEEVLSDYFYRQSQKETHDGK